MKITKGYVYLVKLNPSNSGIKKTRPCLVVQDNKYNNVIGSTVVVPLFSSEDYYKRPKSIVEVDEKFLKGKSVVLAHLITSVSNDRFVKEIGKISRLQYVKVVQSVIDLIK